MPITIDMTTSPNTATPTDGQEPTNNTGTSSAKSKETTASDMPTKDTNTKTDEGASSAQPSNKKRRSNIQLNKDDHPEGNSDDDDGGELNDEGTKRSDPFKRASEVRVFIYVTCYLIYIMYCNIIWIGR